MLDLSGRRGLRALAHPLWIGALVLLIANDHLFKHGRVLPPWLSGKLSDFTGLLVAGPLLVALAGCRGRRGVVACNLVLAAGFVALKTSPAASQLYERALAWLPARNTVDPSDLWALAVLPVSVWLSERALADPAPRRVAEGLLAIAASIACVATSAVPPPACPPDGSQDNVGCSAAFRSTLYVGNQGPVTAHVSIAVLKPGAPVKCQELLAGLPCSLAPEWLDQPLVTKLRPGENFPIPARVCSVAVVTIDDWAVPAIVSRDVDPARDDLLVPFVSSANSPTPSLPGALLFDAQARRIDGAQPFVCEEAK